MFGFLPLIIALLVADTTANTRPLAPISHAWTLILVMVLAVGVWALINEAVSRALARIHNRKLMLNWEMVAQTVILSWFIWACYGWGWSAWAARGHLFGYSLAIAPWVALQTAHWWSLTPAVRSMSSHPWSRSGFVIHQFRFSVLPMVLILPLIDLGPWFASHWDIDDWFKGYWGLLLAAYCVQLFMAVLLVLMPLALMPLWGAKRMLDGDLQRMMLDACRHMGVQVAGLMRWPVPGGRIYNAAVIGMLPRLRYVLFTDDLMHDLPPNQVLAVLGHELGHARHGHLWLYFIFVNCTVMISFLLRDSVPRIIRPLLGGQPQGGFMSSDDPWAPLLLLGVGLVMIGLLFRFVFGYLSRACERQADLAGAELVGDPQIMGEALKSVAHLSGHPENEPSWRHYSIAERVVFLERVRNEPAIAAQHHHLVDSMRKGLFALIFLLFAGVWFFDPARQAPDISEIPAMLRQEVDNNHDLDMALQQADAGDVRALTNLVNRAEPVERQNLAKLLLYSLPGNEPTEASDESTLAQSDDRNAYYYRHRLRPFADIITGKVELDDVLDNALAYISVAGTDNPTPEDVEIAKSLLPRLIAHVTNDPQEHGIYDTIACVEAQLGQYAKAQEHWKKALQLLNALPNPTQFVHTNTLYRRRLEVARANTLHAGRPGFVPIPFPRDWPNSPSTVPPSVPLGQQGAAVPIIPPPSAARPGVASAENSL